ncbi:MAG: alpha/beta fold hydrolase [Propionibacteriales bacterium]|nr:alpha/beta fold hydrolase [Propionibacteriales bacterium]
MTDSGQIEFVVVHGHRRAYRMMGSGPALLLLHGLGCDSSTWFPVMHKLAENFTVLAPDLLGHGESDKPDADYSLGGYANGMRDLLTILGIDKVTVVGHSFGGGVAMQFAYQFPERTERIALVSTGGLGPEVTPFIRFLTVPGSGAVVGASTIWPLRPLVAAGLRGLSKLPLAATRDLDEVAAIYESFADPRARRAVQRVTGHVLNWRRQYVTMTDRAYLAQWMPVLVIWGKEDFVIPSSHAETVSAYAPNAEVHVFEKSGHFPHKDHPDEFIALLLAFIEKNEPAHYHRGRWRVLLRRGDQPELLAVPVESSIRPDHRAAVPV